MARPSRRMKRVSKSNGSFVLVVLFSVAVCSLILWCTCVGAGAGAAASSSRNLWVSGLSSTTRATDLKTLFSKYGKVSRLKTVSHQCHQTVPFCMDAKIIFMGFINVLQVVGAKVVTNAKSPGARCYGFVTMSSTEEATKCISHLHRTELHGRMISVERVSVGRRRSN